METVSLSLELFINSRQVDLNVKLIPSHRSAEKVSHFKVFRI